MEEVTTNFVDDIQHPQLIVLNTSFLNLYLLMAFDRFANNKF
jgi:hypothetical protein